MRRFLVAAILVAGCRGDGGSSPAGTISAPPIAPSPAGEFRVAFAVFTATVWDQVKRDVRAGDFIVTNSVPLGLQMVADVPGLKVAIFNSDLNSISTADGWLAAHPLPPEIDYVGYDYEPGYQAEFTFVQADAEAHFERAAAIAAAHGKKVFPTPFNPFRNEAQPKPWDMGEIALRCPDALDVQLQRTMQTSVDFFKSSATRVRDDVMAKKPDAILFVQISFALSDWRGQSDESTLQQLTDAANWAKEQDGIAGVFVIYDAADPSLLLSLVRSLRAA